MALATRQTLDSPPNKTAPADPKRTLRIKVVLFLTSLVVSVAVFVGIDYAYSKVVLGSAVSGGAHGLCFSRDPMRSFAFLPNCSCVRPWLGASYEFKTNSLGFRDAEIRTISATEQRPRVLVLGDSASEGMTDWHDSFVGRLADHFPQYDFLNSSVEGYSPSNYLNTERMVTNERIDFDEVIVFLDISDIQDEAAFFHDDGTTGAVKTAQAKVAKSNAYSDARLWINNNLLLTNDVFQFVEKGLVGLGWYHLDLGHGGNEFDLERSAWTYRPVSDSAPYEIGYAPLGVEGGIARAKAKMDKLYEELHQRNIPLSVAVYPWPAQLAHDRADSRQVQIWQQWCEGRCKRFIDMFPAFFALKGACSPAQPGCWYLNDFIFGDTHYNSAGDEIAAKILIKSLTASPVDKHSEGPSGSSREVAGGNSPTQP